MMALRDCVRRYHRLPQTLVLDGGLEFSSVYFEALLARYECTQKIRPPSKARFGSVCERLFGSTNTRFIYNLIGNTQMTKGNVRHITKEVNPKNLAAWTLQQLYERLREYAFEVYDTIQHPALGQPPRDAFLAGQARSGHRSHRYIAANEEFKMLTVPTTNKGTARVIPGRGVKINYIFYLCEGFRDAAVEGTEVPIRYDPFDVGHAYAFIRHQWRQCVSEHYLAFSEHSERELMIGSAEIRQRNKQHGRHFTLTARKLADFLNSVGAEEAALIHKQRRRDVEARRIALEFEEGTSGRQIHSVPPGSVCRVYANKRQHFSHPVEYHPECLH